MFLTALKLQRCATRQWLAARTFWGMYLITCTAALALLNDDLQDRDNQIQAIKYENVASQRQRDVYQAQL